MNQVFNATEELADTVNYPDIRVFTVAQNFSSTPFYDIASIELPWSVPSPGNFCIFHDFRIFATLFAISVISEFGKELYTACSYVVFVLAVMIDCLALFIDTYSKSRCIHRDIYI